jgi:hypothetical protein
MKKILFVAMASVLCGCASGISNVQKDEYQSYEAKGYAVKEKEEGTAAVLGILPGGGSFYTRNYGYGVVNLLFWPASILWDPISGVNGAESLNYHATMANVEKMRRKDLRALDEQLALGNIDQTTYIVQKNEIAQKYEP